jgi:hypothetical protein
MRRCDRCFEMSDDTRVCDDCGDAVCFDCREKGYWGFVRDCDLCDACADEPVIE